MTSSGVPPKRSAIAVRQRRRPSVGPFFQIAASRAIARVTVCWNAATGNTSSAGAPAAKDSTSGSATSRMRSRTVESLACSAARATLPRHANGAAPRVGCGGDERAATDVAAHEPARFELAVRAHHGRAADPDRARQVPLGRQLIARPERALRQATLDEVDEHAIHRPLARHAGRLDANRPKEAIHRLVLFQTHAFGIMAPMTTMARLTDQSNHRELDWMASSTSTARSSRQPRPR